MAKVLILGGRGYVGRSVCKALSKHTVYTFDRHKGGSRHIKGDILSEKDLRRAIRGKSVVVNLVGLSPLRTPAEGLYWKVHVDAVEKLVHVCKDLKVKRLVHMSVLGADSRGKTKFLKTRGRGQLLVEHSGLKYNVIRPSLIYGVENELVQQAVSLAPSQMFPRIDALVQPVFVGDVAKFVAKAVNGRVKHSVVDVIGPEKMTLFDFVSQIYSRLGYACYGVPLFLVRFGMEVFSEFGWLGVGKDQIKSLDIDNVSNSRIFSKYVKPKAYSSWVKKVKV